MFVSQENSRLLEELNVAYTKVRIINLNRRCMIYFTLTALLIDDHVGCVKSGYQEIDLRTEYEI